MNTKKVISGLIVLVVAGAAISDAIRYLKPDDKNKTIVHKGNPEALSNPKKIIFVYNAYGGIFPGIADIINKEFFPKSYPCNLCFHAFGTFGKKEAWKNFLGTIPLQKVEFHKDDFRRKFEYPENLPLILIANNSRTEVLLSAAELNTAKSLEDLITLTKQKLEKYQQ